MPPKKIKSNKDGTQRIDDDTKRYFDAIESLRQAAWQSFDRRRAFEWKLSFGLWTALGAIIGGLAIGEATLQSQSERGFLIGFCAAVILIHGVWAFIYLDKVNRADLKKSYAYEHEQMLAVGKAIKKNTAKKINETIAKMERRCGLAKRLGHVIQVVITVILAAGVFVLATRVPQQEYREMKVKIIRKQDLRGTPRHVRNQAYESYRFLLASDRAGVTVTDIVLTPGVEEVYGYDTHTEIAYCIEGSATLTEVGTGHAHEVAPGTMWVAERGARIRFLAHLPTRLICVFSPPFQGKETGFAGNQ